MTSDEGRMQKLVRRPIRGRECFAQEKEVGQRRKRPRDAEQGDEGKDKRQKLESEYSGPILLMSSGGR